MTRLPAPAESREGSEPVPLKPSRKAEKDEKEPSEKKPRAATPKKAASESEPADGEPAGSADGGGTAQVVSLDAFRKKN